MCRKRRLTFFATAGFSLIELLVVLTILGLIATAVPYIMNQGSGPKTRSSARALVADLEATRDTAIRRQRVTELLITDKNNGYLVGGENRFIALPEGVKLSFTPAQPALTGSQQQTLTFYPDGSATGGNITLSCNGHVISVTIDWLDGRITING